MNDLKINIIAKIYNGFNDKFGIARQSMVQKNIKSRIIFEPEYRNFDSIRGLENISHIWLIWQFSKFADKKWTPLVRPPRLGGNKQMGVFATRSPHRPNSLGLSVVKIEKIELDKNLGPIIHVLGADLMNQTPIFDIKPYISYADCITDADSGIFEFPQGFDNVIFTDSCKQNFKYEILSEISEILQQDPRPAYKRDSEDIFKFEYKNFHIEFYAKDNKAYVNQIKLIKK